MRNFVGALFLLLPATALADGDSWLTLGVGTVVSTSASDPAADRTTGELRLKLRALKILGAELAYQSASQTSVESTAASFYLHLVPSTPLGAYLKAGIAATTLAGLQKRTWLEYGYHAGLGLELHFTEHVVFVAEGTFVSPVRALTKLQGPAGIAGAKEAFGYRASLGLMLFI